MPTDPRTHIPATLRALRQSRGWSLDRCAQATAVSKAMLGQIERGESSPTVATLWKLASGFGVSFSAFFVEAAHGEAVSSAAEPSQDAPRTADAGTVDWQDAAGMALSVLVPFEAALGCEMFLVTLAPGAASDSAPHAAGTIEHVIALDAGVEVEVEGQWHRLAAGQTLRFAADRAHAYRNRRAQPVRFHDLVHYPR
ncbi:helix-turn-helix domain-containing protein [Halomonas sp. HP20-15]|uniref:helix-turn-helix domain-containing protein n=1 Tax=Halomonas sp. HP20-15 TaxID=3085901 RepID=UPI0029825789|nr:helix-turn-helix domain-containing protein [Halomonas sp. HP20-15]MDW5375323.1 helix-turn-helix domain-containing protein [Halomonas sp. HP20-15]